MCLHWQSWIERLSSRRGDPGVLSGAADFAAFSVHAVLKRYWE
jgi:hypothetical protein